MKLITQELLNDLLEKSVTSPRKRMNYNVHEHFSDIIQKMFVGTKKASYFRPHKHADKSEFALVVKGSFDILLFNNSGDVIQRVNVGAGCEIMGFEIEANVWHTWLPLEDDSIFFEVKQGPYDPKGANEFAEWSPADESSEVIKFIERLKNAEIGDSFG